MAIALGTVGTAVEVAGTELECSIDLPAGHVLGYQFGIHNESADPTSAVWNGSEGMVLVDYIFNSGTRGSGLYLLAGATAGSHSAIITTPASETMAGRLFTLSGVNTSDVFDAASVVSDAEATGDQDLDVSITSPAGDLAFIAVCAALAAASFTPTNGTVEDADNTANFWFGLLSRAGQGGATQINGSFAANPFGFSTVGVNLNAAATGLHRHMASYRRRRA